MFKKYYHFKYMLPLLFGIIVLLLFVLLLGPKENNSAIQLDDLLAPEIASVKEIGLVQNPARPTFVRDGGAGAVVGGKYLWTFGDTLFNPRSIDGSSGRSNTAGYAEVLNPLQVSEPLDQNYAPQQMIPFSPSDKAYNDATKKGDDRYAIWPGLVVPRPKKNDALIYFLRLKVNPGGSGLNYDLLNSGIARIDEDSTSARVIVPELFKKPETFYNGPGFVKDGTVYFYECPSTSLKKCSFAKVPIDQAEERSAYQFWDGKTWQADYEKAAKQFYGSSSGTTIGYLAAFKQYIVFYNMPFSKDMYVSTSKSLTNGWSEPKKFYSAVKNNYALTYHPELSTENGKKILLTYYQSGSGIHAITVDLK